MRKTYAQYWWPFFLRGSIAVIFGLAALLLPGITVDVLVLLIGAFFFADGVLSLIGSFGTRRVEARWWAAFLEGIAGVAIGVLTFVWPGVTLVAVIFLIGAWALTTGILEIIAAFRLRKVIDNEWLLALSGVISIIFGIILFGSPALGAVALVWIIGIYAVFFGTLMIFLGFKLKKLS